MKKTLVAVAALAATSAFAQVSITGSVAMGYRISTGVGATAASTGTDQSGLGIDTTALNFVATEDLGGGMSARAAMSIDGMNRGGIAGGDSSLALTTGAGRVTLATGRGSDYLSGGVAGVGGVGWDGKVTSGLNASDSIGYTSPAMGGFVFGLSHAEGAVDRASELTAPIGLGVGAAGTPVAANYQRSTGASATYSAGKLVATLGYAMYDQAGTTVTNAKNITSVAANYDFGAVKLGAGFRNLNWVIGTRQDALVSIAAPLGALTLGANWVSRTMSDTVSSTGASTSGTRTGTSVKADYALSKRTSVVASYARWDAAIGAASASTETNLLLAHSF